MAHPTRRQFLKAAGKAAALLPLPALAQGSSGRVVVIGGDSQVRSARASSNGWIRA